MTATTTATELQQAFSGRRVMVTGAAGFIGRHLCQRLFQFGSDVHAIGRGTCPANFPCTAWYQVDCTDYLQVQAVTRNIRPETVVHLAGVADGRQGREWVLPTFHGNLSSAVHILAAASELGCKRIVLAGSLEEPLIEEILHIPINSPYAISKFATSLYADLFRRLYDAPVLTARIFMTYGPGQAKNKLIPTVISELRRGSPIRIDSGGREVDWIYIDDTVDGLLAVTSMTTEYNGTLDIGCGQLYSIRHVVQRIADILQSDIRPQYLGNSPRANERVVSANLEKTKQLTGWSPTISLEQGLESTIQRAIESSDSAT